MFGQMFSVNNMPHCIIEYSENLNHQVDDIVCAVRLGACDSQLFEVCDIKIRAMPFAKYVVGTSDASFIHVSSRILSGRSLEQKLRLNRAIVEHIKILDVKNCAITAEVIDIHRESYIKFET